MFSSGEYSDYGYMGAFVALQDVTHEQMKEIEGMTSQKADEAEDDNEWSCRHSMFQAALIRNGWLAVIDLHEIHIGSYGDLIPSPQTE